MHSVRQCAHVGALRQHVAGYCWTWAMGHCQANLGTLLTWDMLKGGRGVARFLSLPVRSKYVHWQGRKCTWLKLTCSSRLQSAAT